MSEIYSKPNFILSREFKEPFKAILKDIPVKKNFEKYLSVILCTEHCKDYRKKIVRFSVKFYKDNGIRNEVMALYFDKTVGLLILNTLIFNFTNSSI